MTKQITFHVDNEELRYSGQTFELIRVGWDPETQSWIADPSALYWGIISPATGNPEPFFLPVEDFGTVKEIDPDQIAADAAAAKIMAVKYHE